MILNENYSQIERSSDTLDMKTLGPNTFGLMKQSRNSTKFIFQGLKELVKFGKFAEIEAVQASRTLIGTVTEEYVAPARSNLSSSFEVVDDSDDDDANDGDDDSNDDDDADNSNDDSDSDVSPKQPISKDVDTPAETENDVNIFKRSKNPTPKQMDALIAQL
ncbi:unnamed protein product [Lactuca saligna]|uniref:Uncharacterized protein n=1 Tax=Lactuca saligna TaxID=75948 RepID=A0AA35VNG4_LACSI|nr:unnamed protein product [Lactuca saligna]